MTCNPNAAFSRGFASTFSLARIHRPSASLASFSRTGPRCYTARTSSPHIQDHGRGPGALDDIGVECLVGDLDDGGATAPAAAEPPDLAACCSSPGASTRVNLEPSGTVVTSLPPASCHWLPLMYRWSLMMATRAPTLWGKSRGAPWDLSSSARRWRCKPRFAACLSGVLCFPFSGASSRSRRSLELLRASCSFIAASS